MKSLLTESLRQTPKRVPSVQELMNRLNRMQIPPTFENRTVVASLIKRGTINNIRYILNTYNLNMNQYRAFENEWVSRILKNTNTPEKMRHVLNTYSSRLSPSSKRLFQLRWVNLLLQSGSAKNIENALKSNLNNKSRNNLSNVLAIRKLNSSTLKRLVSELSPARTPMARRTVNSFRRELLLRKQNY